MLPVKVVCVLIFATCVTSQRPESEAADWLQEYNDRAEQVFFKSTSASWDYQTNLTDYNQRRSVAASLESAAFRKEAYRNATQFDFKNFGDKNLTRLFRKITDIGTASLPEDKVSQVSNLNAKLSRTYSTGKVCKKPGDADAGRCYPLDPDLTRILSKSRDWDELVWAWDGWRDATGKLMKDDFEQFVALLNEAAVKNGYADNGEYWRSWYEMSNLESECNRLWEEIKPLYVNLHAYVRRKLKENYSSHGNEFPSTGHIPAHILGNMWAQEWEGIMDIVEPYKGIPSVDVTDAMVNQGYNVTHIFRVSEEFFTSLGLEPLPQPFWDHSMLEKPADRDVVCHASAWDFSNRRDFRVKQCTDITMSWLITTHHELGHIQYDLLYKDQPLPYRGGANPGFHEAVGDILSLSVSTPEHLHQIGLLSKVTNSKEADINFLMSQALKKIAFLPFGFLIDQWRWSVFKGDTTKVNYNQKWWELRCKYQGVSPPVSRSADDFDPGAKFHVPGNYAYIRYFVAHVVQFQFHKAACQAANNTRPLHRCDIYRSREAGQLMRDMLSLGSSVPWPEAMERMTGTRTMDAGPLMEYFKPLTDWLKEQNAGHETGWTDACPVSAATYLYTTPVLLLCTYLIAFSLM